ncbi:MAG: Glucosyltransferase-like protein [Tremellales sp. Tagirdzhanova-0007]|nr:MAG: Glucosyltransferase-like protein [Tremellales sp. Tagirdzhanova-0007]
MLADASRSETDAESLASFSTYLSSSSQHTFPSNLSRRVVPHDLLNPNRRTVSSSSLSHSSVSRLHPPSPSLTVPHPLELQRDGARSKRRAERDKRARSVAERFDSPLRRWLRWMSSAGLSRASLGIGLIGVGVIKTAVGFGGFSGRESPPMFGDFEAQRHWMEVTIHRPMGEWYSYAPDWWLLDYPPLTGYASWLCGRIGTMLNPSHFALDESRGQSPPALVTYMRFSVLCFESLVWWSAVVAWMMTGIMTVLLQPSLTLIDNGHFQYNSVLLGLSLFCLLFLSRNQDMLACIAFSLALCFKQMGLYFAPSIGCYLLGKCIWLGGTQGLVHFAKLGAVTTATFVAIFAPWLRPFPESLGQIISRIFPFARGIFEDKVANFWCASNVVIKWKKWVSVPGMARLATLATLLAILPTVCMLFYLSLSVRSTSPLPSTTTSTLDKSKLSTIASSPPPTIQLLPTALFTSSLSFFLFSFQVHEKSILLPLMPLTLMMATRSGRGEDEIWDAGVLVNNVAVFSMWPLLVRDGQALQYVVVTLLWNYVIGYSPVAVQSPALRYAGYAVYSSMALIHILDMFPRFFPVPSRYPDLFIVLNMLGSFSVFLAAWFWGVKRLVEGAWAIVGLSGKKVE